MDHATDKILHPPTNRFRSAPFALHKIDDSRMIVYMTGAELREIGHIRFS